ncbi:aldo/keto reductase [Nonomuraea roseoviolacea]|uniref:aldo/keto reductase n=1 Tax=Nonomuraea roseoviolacea TaxID=103837 RepID=UPI0031DA3723
MDLLPECRRRSMPVMAYSPIEQGRLLGSTALREVAAAHRATPAQVALAWVLRDDPMIAIPEAAIRDHVQENAAALDLRLTADDLSALDRAFPGARPQGAARHAVIALPSPSCRRLDRPVVLLRREADNDSAPGAGAGRVRGRAVPADELDFGRLLQPVGEGGAEPIGRHTSRRRCVRASMMVVAYLRVDQFPRRLRAGRLTVTSPMSGGDARSGGREAPGADRRW